jgi:hypothetical protein
MNFIQHLASELGLDESTAHQAVIVAADRTVRQYLDHKQITPSSLTPVEQAGIVAAVRLADPKFPRHALSLKQRRH